MKRLFFPWLLVALHGQTAPAESTRELVERFAEDQGNITRYYDLPMSEPDRERKLRFLQDWRTRLSELNFDELPQEGRIDWILLRNYLRRESLELEHERQRDAEIAPLLPFAENIATLAARRRAVELTPARKSADALEEIKHLAEKAKRDLEEDKESAKKIKRAVARRATNRLRGLQRTLDEWSGFYRDYDPQFLWWTDKPQAECKAALENYGKALRDVFDLKEDAVIGDPIGEAALLDALAAEMIPYTPSELVEIAEKEFAWCEREWRKAARDLGFGDDWRKALDHVSNLYAGPGEQPRLIRDLAYEAVDYLERNDLVTIPLICKETWRMEMMSPERQKVNPYFTGGEVISVSFPTADMAHEDKLMSLRGNNRHFCRATVHHELIPGHHLQLYMSQRHRPHRRLFRTPFLVEGWCLYWEMLLWDMGFQQSAEDRVGMLFWRTHRCARIVFSLNFHLGRMSAGEAIDYLVERVGHERRNAEAEVRRSVGGGYDPLYQAAYMLGGLQLRALRGELVESGKMKAKEFHDAVLKENSIPIEMIRASLTNQPLKPDFTSAWRFHEGLPKE